VNEDQIGDRFKAYEACWDFALPHRLPMVIRVDGRSFHSLPLEKPFDTVFHGRMTAAAIALCDEIQGARFAFYQSDEISVIARDDQGTMTQPWLGKRLQRIVSLSAAIASKAFGGREQFDARAFVLPDESEVINYCIWRQQDATRNSVSMAARAVFSHKQCDHKNTPELVQMLQDAGKPWEATPTHFKRGTVMRSVLLQKPIPAGPREGEFCERREWMADREPPIFTQDRDYIRAIYGSANPTGVESAA